MLMSAGSTASRCAFTRTTSPAAAQESADADERRLNRATLRIHSKSCFVTFKCRLYLFDFECKKLAD
jgi:hypothetical protein